MSLFKEVRNPTDPAFIQLAESDHRYSVNARAICEQLWQQYKTHADRHFLDQIGRDFYSRFWEMHLTCTLEKAGFSITSEHEGPDIKIQLGDQVIWIEAVAPTRGSGKDQVPDMNRSGIQSIPEEEILLRYRTSIEEKYAVKRPKYLEKRIVGMDDSYIVAICSTKLGFCLSDDEPPRIAKAVLPMGDRFYRWSLESDEVKDGGFTHRDNVKRASGAEVSTDLFLREEYSGLSAVICSNADPFNYPTKNGADLVLVHNPNAREPVREGTFQLGREYVTALGGEAGKITRRDWYCDGTS